VRKLKHARIGALGARPAAFNTVRYSEKLLEASGITVETLDLSEVLGWIKSMKDDDRALLDKLGAIKEYTNVSGIPKESLVRMAKLGVAIDRWVRDQQLTATAIQCWTALEEFYGVVPCCLMSMMSNNLVPSACETDIAGLVGMYILQAASGQPAALLDWNNNYSGDPNKGVVFHCSNLPKAFFGEQKMDYQEIIAGTVGKENTYGTIVGRISPGPFTYCRVSTDDLNGRIASYVGEGQFTKDKLDTFGGYGVIEVPRFQKLLQFICRNGYEHHVAATKAPVADAIADALGTYLGWQLYHHEPNQA
jgi:L-fucose isomerase-like protein